MFIILLKFSANRDKAKDCMQGHKAWLEKGFESGLFLLSGGLEPKVGGGIIAHNATMDTVTAYVNQDPFVQENVVTADIIELSASKADPRLNFLIN